MQRRKTNAYSSLPGCGLCVQNWSKRLRGAHSLRKTVGCRLRSVSDTIHDFPAHATRIAFEPLTPEVQSRNLDKSCPVLILPAENKNPMHTRMIVASRQQNHENRRKWLPVGFVVLLSACFDPAPIYTENSSEPCDMDRIKSGCSGYGYCQYLSKKSNDASALFLTLAIISTILSGSAILIGTVLGPDNRDGAQWFRRGRGTLLVGLGGLLAVPTTTFYLGQNRASMIAGIATKAMLSTRDREAYQICILAKADWVSSRTQTADTLFSQYQKSIADRPQSTTQKPPDIASSAKQAAPDMGNGNTDMKP